MSRLENFRAWFLGLEKRERIMFAAGAAALLVSLLYAGAIEPFIHAKTELRNRMAEKHELSRWMQNAAVEIQALRGATPVLEESGGSLLAVVDSSAKASGISAAIRSMQQDDGGRSVRIRLENASFDNLVRWLDALRRRHGITAATISVDRNSQNPGTVNVSLTLERPGA